MQCGACHFKIKINSIHTLNGALDLRYVSARVTFGAVVAHRQSLHSPSSQQNFSVFQYFRISVLLIKIISELLSTSESRLNDLNDTACVRWCGTVGFYERNQCFLVGQISSFFLVSTIPSFPSFYGLDVWRWGLRIDIVLHISQHCIADSFLLIIYPDQPHLIIEI